MNEENNIRGGALVGTTKRITFKLQREGNMLICSHDSRLC